MTQKVLCADDEELIRDALSFFLEHLGLEARCCSNGRECIEEFQRSPESYALVLVNYDMPGMNGLDCLRKLRSLDPQKRICLTSAYPGEFLLSRAEKGELEEFLPKPYSLRKLRRFLLRNLQGKRAACAHVVTNRAGWPHTGGVWLKTLCDVGGTGLLSVRTHSDAEVAVTSAQEGFPNVVLYDVESVPPRISQLERLRSEGIPVVFAGSLSHGHGLERFGVVLDEHALERDGVELVRKAALEVQG